MLLTRFVTFIRSSIARMPRIAVSLKVETATLASGGNTSGQTCGRITRRNTLLPGRPSARAASHWPRGIAVIPARITSQM